MDHLLWEETSNYRAYPPHLDENHRASFYFEIVQRLIFLDITIA